MDGVIVALCFMIVVVCFTRIFERINHNGRKRRKNGNSWQE